MRSTLIATAFAALSAAAPTKRQATKGGPSDGVILNYALTLEHLENTFYKEVLQKFTLADFQAVGLDNVFYKNLQTISSDEQTHVEFLTTALTAAGVTPVVANEYNFGLTDVPSFLTLVNILEGVGVSAYLGAAQFIASGDYLTAAGSILTVEARHSAYLRDSKRPQQLSPFPSPFDTPLSINAVYTLASPFITKNNNPNADLPVMAYTGLSYAGAPAAIGSTIEVTSAKEVSATEAYFYSVTGPIKAGLSGSGSTYQITIPEGTPAGQSYAVLTKGGLPTDETIVAGPAIIEIQDAQFGVVRDSPCADSAPSYGSNGSGSSGSGSGTNAPSYTQPQPSTTSGGSQPVNEAQDGQVTVTDDCEETHPSAPAGY
ncbi:unnamed protein product [Zymoseptoria tritici ST99CH_1A5]|uniref:Ferritin-like diiron domain-containing protein n=1 Tax=Zymoseptoria tritici ST99CH_1A5 TaxID=1276529 RepID=A0A1Y6LBN3_ZYMTR|nr:unnamed protein product [Zymoseptoria tritici ST99CH_1A5]